MTESVPSMDNAEEEEVKKIIKNNTDNEITLHSIYILCYQLLIDSYFSQLSRSSMMHQMPPMSIAVRKKTLLQLTVSVNDADVQPEAVYCQQKGINKYY